MDQIYTAANYYYAMLERLGFRYPLKSGWFWGLLVSVVVFVGSGVWWLVAASESRNWIVSVIYISELLIVGLSFMFGLSKTKLVLKRIYLQYNHNFGTVDEARRFLLGQVLGRQEVDYLEFSDYLDKVISLQDKVRSPFSLSISQVMLFLYNPDSKQRIFALLIVVASMLTALAIHDGRGISDVFDFFRGADTALVLFVWGSVVLYLAGILYVLRLIWIGIEPAWSYVIVRVGAKEARIPYLLRYLQRDLLKFHRVKPVTHEPSKRSPDAA